MAKRKAKSPEPAVEEIDTSLTEDARNREAAAHAAFISPMTPTTPAWLKDAQAKSAAAPTPASTRGNTRMSDNATFTSAADLGLSADALGEVRLPLDKFYDVWITEVQIAQGSFGPQARVKTRFDDSQRGDSELAALCDVVGNMFTYISIKGGAYQKFCAVFGIADALNHRWDNLTANPIPASVRLKETSRTVEVETPDGEKLPETRTSYQVAPGCWFAKG